jgi:DNA-binding LytR/AlgR family response regulator
MIHTIALDDEIPALKLIELFANKTEGIRLDKTFHIADEALRYLNQFPVDLIFLDINMPSLSGLEFHAKLKQDTMVIFTTAYSEYAVEGFNLNAVDYLLKPFSYKRFKQAVDKAQEIYKMKMQQDKDQSALYIRSDYSLVKIVLDNITYIEALDDYLRLHLKNQKPILTRMTIKAILSKLPAQRFVRVHRSFVVPVERIDSVRNKMIYIGENEIPIGASYEADFLKAFNK